MTTNSVIAALQLMKDIKEYLSLLWSRELYSRIRDQQTDTGAPVNTKKLIQEMVKPLPNNDVFSNALTHCALVIDKGRSLFNFSDKTARYLHKYLA